MMYCSLFDSKMVHRVVGNLPKCSNMFIAAVCKLGDNWCRSCTQQTTIQNQYKINICSWRLYHFLVERPRSPTNKWDCKVISNRCCYHDTKDTLENTDFQQPDAFPDGNVAPSGTDDGFQQIGTTVGGLRGRCRMMMITIYKVYYRYRR